MNYTKITAHIIDQSIQLANLPLLASGGIEEVRIDCDFCSLWSGLGKSAVFYRKDGPVYHIPLVDGTVVIPWEVMTEAGVVYFGVIGTDGTTTRTTEVLRLSIEQGALTVATADHEDPTPDVYEQILAAFGRVDSRLDEETAARKAEVAVERARIDNVVAMRSTEGATVFTMTADGLTGTITTNGAAAFVECIPTFTIPAGQYANFYIPAYLAPMVPTEISYDRANITVTVRTEGSTGKPMISFYNAATAAITLQTKPAIGSYSLASVGISELGDVRVGFDGTVYESAGEAVREQIKLLDEKKVRMIKNVINLNALTDGGYLDALGGWVADAYYSTTDFIPCKKGDCFRQKGRTKNYASNVSYYNSDKEYVTSTVFYDHANPWIVVPDRDDIAFVRLPVSHINNDTQYVYNTSELIDVAVPFDVPFAFCYDFVTSGGKKLSDLEVAKNHWEGKTWYAYGTSITSEIQGKYVPYLAELSGMNAVNKGIAGGGLTNLGGFSTGHVKAAIMNTTDGKLEADLITLEVGANEGGELGTKYDTGDTTFCGCLNQCIRYLQRNTNAQIVVMYSIPSILEPSLNSTHIDREEKVREVCNVNNVYYLGDGSGLGYARISNGNTYVVDNVHQTEVGGYNLAQFMWSKLKDIPLWYTSIPT